jgi:hypothetical protein
VTETHFAKLKKICLDTKDKNKANGWSPSTEEQQQILPNAGRPTSIVLISVTSLIALQKQLKTK